MTMSYIATAFIVLFGLSAGCSQQQAKEAIAKNPTAEPTVIDGAKRSFKGRAVPFSPVQLQSGSGQIVIDVELPSGYHFSPEAPSAVVWRSSNRATLWPSDTASPGGSIHVSYPIQLSYHSSSGETELEIEASLYYCEDKSRACLIDNVKFLGKVVVTDSGATQLRLPIEVQPPDGL